MDQIGGASPYSINRTIPTLIWGREADGFHTRISLFNYYSLLIEDRPVHANAYAYLFTEDGREFGRFERKLEPLQQWQFELSSVTRAFQGTVAVQLVPDSLPALKHQKYVGTLFFATYWDDQGHCDFTHETDRMRFAADRHNQYEPAVIPSSKDLEMSVIVQNSFFGEDPSDCDPYFAVELRDHRGKSLIQKRMSLGPRASSVLPLRDLFPNYQVRLAGEVGSIHIRGRHINQPLTFLRHRSGDFNIHHF